MGNGSCSKPTAELCFISLQHQITQTPLATDGVSITILQNAKEIMQEIIMQKKFCIIILQPVENPSLYPMDHQMTRICTKSAANDMYEEGAMHDVSSGTAMFW